MVSATAKPRLFNVSTASRAPGTSLTPASLAAVSEARRRRRRQLARPSAARPESGESGSSRSRPAATAGEQPVPGGHAADEGPAGALGGDGHQLPDDVGSGPEQDAGGQVVAQIEHPPRCPPPLRSPRPGRTRPGGEAARPGAGAGSGGPSSGAPARRWRSRVGGALVGDEGPHANRKGNQRDGGPDPAPGHAGVDDERGHGRAGECAHIERVEAHQRRGVADESVGRLGVHGGVDGAPGDLHQDQHGGERPPVLGRRREDTQEGRPGEQRDPQEPAGADPVARCAMTALDAPATAIATQGARPVGRR